jgi:hypothetical protein
VAKWSPLIGQPVTEKVGLTLQGRPHYGKYGAVLGNYKIYPPLLSPALACFLRKYATVYEIMYGGIQAIRAILAGNDGVEHAERSVPQHWGIHVPFVSWLANLKNATQVHTFKQVMKNGLTP